MKIKGIKKAVGDYNRSNAQGYYSGHYGYIMLNRVTGEVWTDEFYSIGHNEWKEYHDPAIINLGREVETVKMKTIRAAAERICAEYNA